MNKLLILITILLFSLNFYPQTLIKTSFENYDSTYWYSPTKATPDLINIKINDYPWLQNNINKPFFGDNMLGLRLTDLQNSHREYIAIKLQEPIIKISKYRISLQISRNCSFDYESNNFGFLFTNDSIINENIANTYFPQINIDSLITSINWVHICDTLIISKPYKYLVLGNFHRNSETKYTKTQNCRILEMYNNFPSFNLENTFCAYYFIDNLEITCLDSNYFENTLSSTYILNDLAFDINNYHLKNTMILNEIIEQLKKYNNIKLEISGHTDNSGDEMANQALSENRAKAVYEYLVSKGVDSNRLAFKGYGSTIPIADNQTNEGREKNRRVEIKILEN